MTEPIAQPPPEEGSPTTTAGRMSVFQRAGGIVPALLTAVFAFFMGGLVVAATGHDPLDTYIGIPEAPSHWFWDTGTPTSST
jgi:hypothetical protein